MQPLSALEKSERIKTNSPLRPYLLINSWVHFRCIVLLCVICGTCAFVSTQRKHFMIFVIACMNGNFSQCYHCTCCLHPVVLVQSTTKVQEQRRIDLVELRHKVTELSTILREPSGLFFMRSFLCVPSTFFIIILYYCLACWTLSHISCRYNRGMRLSTY